MNTGSKKIKLLAVFMATVCVLAFITLTLTSGIEMGHECSGEDCRICMIANLCENVLRYLLISSYAIAVLALSIILCRTFITIVSASLTATPIRLKVKLSD